MAAAEFLIQAFCDALRIPRWREKFVFAFCLMPENPMLAL